MLSHTNFALSQAGMAVSALSQSTCLSLSVPTLMAIAHVKLNLFE